MPSVNPSATTLNAVFARTATDAWAVGQFPGAGEDAGSQIFAERWNGTQWQQAPTTNIVRQDERLLGVSASGPDDAWAVGNTNSISAASHDTLAAHWDGTAWTIAPTPAAASGGRLASLYYVADLSPASAWAVGQGKDARPGQVRGMARPGRGSGAGPGLPAGKFANAVLSDLRGLRDRHLGGGHHDRDPGQHVVRFGWRCTTTAPPGRS